jgi:tetratricopeptide (TPR) repeat protein
MDKIKQLYIDGKIDDFIEATKELDDKNILKLLARTIKLDENIKEDVEKLDISKLSIEDKSILGLIYTILGELDKAEEILKECIEKDESWAYFRYANVKLIEGDLEEAKNYILKGLEKFEKAEAYNNLGFIYKSLDEKEKMLEAYLKAWELKSHDLGIAQKAIEAIKEVKDIEEFKKEIEEKLENEKDKKKKASLFVILGIVEYEIKEIDKALKYFNEAVKLDEENEYIRKVFIDYFLKEERYWALGNRLKEWVEKYENVDEELALIECRIKAGFLETAKESLDNIKDKIKSQKLQYEILKSKYYIEEKEFEKAKEILEKLYEEYPNNKQIVISLGDLYKTMGELDKSLEILEEAHREGPAFLMRKVDLKEKLTNEEFKRLEKFYENEEDYEHKSSIAFALADAYDKVKNYKKASFYIKKANEELFPILDYSIDEFRKEIDEIINSFSKEWIEGKQNRIEFNKRPIFIVGMPRSGTTMLEQIFATHNKVFGAGELPYIGKVINLSQKITDKKYPYSFLYSPKRLLKEAGQYYIELTEKLYSFDEPIFIDKLPHNFMHSAILTAMFANSKIIALRRDYRSIALSNYFQNFAAKKGTLGYSFDLKAMGEHLKDYMKIMKFYKEILPEDRYKEFWYEDLVLNPKEKIPEVLEFCDLDFTEELLEFYKNKTAVQTASVTQVRNPIYTKSVEKWKKYEELLKPVIEIVGNEGTYNG